jgi:hypothetical protein
VGAARGARLRARVPRATGGRRRGSILGGAGQTTGNALWDTTFQRKIPQESMSRVSSYDWFGSLLFNPLGLAVAGPIAAAIGTSTTLAIAGCWFVGASLVLAALPSVRGVRVH